MYTRKMYKSFHTSPNYLEFLQMVNQSNSYSYQLTSYQKNPAFVAGFHFICKTRRLPQRFDLSDLNQTFCLYIGPQRSVSFSFVSIELISY